MPISSTVAFGRPSVSHHLHRHVWQTAHTDLSSIVIGTLLVAHQFHRRIWQVARCPSVPPSRLTGCSLPITYTVARRRSSVAHHLHRRVWNADPRSSGKRRAHEPGRSRSAPRARRLSSSQRSVAARRRETLPPSQPRAPLGIPKAHRRGRTHRSPHRVRLLCDPPRCATTPQRGTLSESRAFDRLERRIHPTRPPNPALQPTASRARSFGFCGRLWARSRQLNAKPLARLMLYSASTML